MRVMTDPAFCKTRLSWETVGNMCPVKSPFPVKIKDLAKQTNICPVKSTFQVKIKDLAKQTNMCPLKSAFQVKIKDLVKETKCKDWQVALTLELVALGVVLLVTYLVILPLRLSVVAFTTINTTNIIVIFRLPPTWL